MILEFSVVGTPVPQGSTRAFSRGGHVHTTNDPSGRIERWRGDIRSAARPAIAGLELSPMGVPTLAAVKVGLVFRFARPAAHFLPANARRAEPELKPTAPHHVTGTADIDKLARAVLDALTAVVWKDDGQVVTVYAAKGWADEAQPGVSVRIVDV